MAIRNGATITNEEIFSVTVRGYSKLGKIKDKLLKEGVISIFEHPDLYKDDD